MINVIVAPLYFFSDGSAWSLQPVSLRARLAFWLCVRWQIADTIQLFACATLWIHLCFVRRSSTQEFVPAAPCVVRNATHPFLKSSPSENSICRQRSVFCCKTSRFLFDLHNSEFLQASDVCCVLFSRRARFDPRFGLPSAVYFSWGFLMHKSVILRHKSWEDRPTTPIDQQFHAKSHLTSGHQHREWPTQSTKTLLCPLFCISGFIRLSELIGWIVLGEIGNTGCRFHLECQ